MAEKIISIGPGAIDNTVIARAATMIQAGKVVIFPTMGLYGLATNALSADAAKRVFSLKQRPPEKPILVLIRHRDDLLPLVNEIPEAADRIMDACWPGGVTLVFQASAALPAILTANTGKIGIRLPQHPVAKALVNQANCPITGTSANISGQPGARQIGDIDSRIIDGVDLVLDAGSLKGGSGSSVVDVTVTPPAILREGAVPVSQIKTALSFFT